MAYHLSGTKCARVLVRHCIYDHRHWNSHFQSSKRPAYQKTWPRKSNTYQRSYDCRCAFWFFYMPFLYYALFVGYSLRTRCRKCGCRTKQLCCITFCQPSHELASLHVGHRRFGGALYYGGCADGRKNMESGIPRYRYYADCPCSDSFYQPPALEKSRLQLRRQ